jgi:hypothetical protein
VGSALDSYIGFRIPETGVCSCIHFFDQNWDNNLIIHPSTLLSLEAAVYEENDLDESEMAQEEEEEEEIEGDMEQTEGVEVVETFTPADDFTPTRSFNGSGSYYHQTVNQQPLGVVSSSSSSSSISASAVSGNPHSPRPPPPSPGGGLPSSPIYEEEEEG